MNRIHVRNLVLLLVAALLAAPFHLSTARADDEETELAKNMEVIEDGMKSLRKSLKSADSNAESTATIAEMKKAATACRELVPAMASEIPEAERAKFIEAYQKDMDVFIKDLDRLNEAVKAGNNDEAQEIYKALKDQEDEGHEKYTQ